MSHSPRTLHICYLQVGIVGGNFWVRHDQCFFCIVLTSYVAAEARRWKRASEKQRRVNLILGPDPKELQEDVDMGEAEDEVDEVDELLHDDWTPVSNFAVLSFFPFLIVFLSLPSQGSERALHCLSPEM